MRAARSPWCCAARCPTARVLYRPGDVCDIDDSIEHAPVAGADGCICVVAQDRPVRFRSMIVRLARPWHGM